MKKKLVLLISIILISAMVFVACANGKKETAKTGSGEKKSGNKPSFVFVVTDQLGDKSFNDSAAEGVKKISEKLGYKTKIMEIGRDQTKWEPTLLDLSESGEYTAIFLNGSGTQEIVEKLANQFPKQKYVLFDASIKEGSYENIYAISYKQNEGSYIGGVLAALVTNSDMKFSNPDKKIGFIGGDTGPIINDFLVGYIEGAKSVDPEIKVYISYVGSWVDTAKAKELANAQFSKGVDIIFPAAMTAGLGVVEAAAEQNKYIIGVDSDQATLLGETDSKKANVILTSVVKEVGESLFRYAEKVGKGEDKYGITDVLGVKDKATGIVQNKYYEENVPKIIKDKVNDATNNIVEGKIIVPTALGANQAEVEKIINSVKP